MPKITRWGGPSDKDVPAPDGFATETEPEQQPEPAPEDLPKTLKRVRSNRGRQ